MQGPPSNVAGSANGDSPSKRTPDDRALDDSAQRPTDPFGRAPRAAGTRSAPAHTAVSNASVARTSDFGGDDGPGDGGPGDDGRRTDATGSVDSGSADSGTGDTGTGDMGTRSRHRVTVACADADLATALVERIGRGPAAPRVDALDASALADAEADVWIVEVRGDDDARRVIDLAGARPKLRIVALDRRAGSSGRVHLLEGGADHVLDGASGADEIAACAAAHLRRLAPKARPALGTDAAHDVRRGTRPARVQVDEDLVVDLGRMQIERGDTRIDLTPLEAGILGHVIENDDRVVARDEILEAVWGSRETRACARTVDVHVVALRRKLHGGSGSQRLLRTVRGLGYRWCG